MYGSGNDYEGQLGLGQQHKKVKLTLIDTLPPTKFIQISGKVDIIYF